MTTRLTRIAAFFALLAAASSTFADMQIIHAGRLLAVPGGRVASNQTVIVEGERIVEVRDGFADAAEFEREVTVIDLREHFVLPGLMDMHVHLQGEMGPDNDKDELKMSPELMQMRSLMYAMRTLKAGFTTVRDTGSSPQEMYALRDSINNGWVDGPRIIAAGGVGITGGHADISGVKPELMEMFTSDNVCDGPYDCRRAARNVIKYGADLIKITSTGGVMTQRATGTDQQMEADELEEIVRAAARMGRKVAAHAHGEDGIIAALEAGVASIEHGSYTGPEAIKVFKRTGAYLVPTLLAGDTVVAAATEADYMADTVKAKAIRVGGDMKGNFAKAHKAGVKVAFGTDSGVSKHGTNAEEAVLMVEAGMSEMDVITSATVNAADLIDMSASLGTIEAGKFADIIAVDGSPLDDIAELLDVAFVMRGGKVFKH
ncbi:MAG: amidohydrolase family protein [Gammaproteobacteria bacterium]|nr:amidohydrolase family protein [Gammaproteobacteria bacterium]MDH3374790.1 amidohydrolase family protein [Gammaproteobacteria bacterium]MDH3410552.1 amidohydrolase family protein [Gammaproteobacteria bacterium]MDH3553037.1 amidohydrolase family protein [Gammaproteobacteria bacterium]